MKHHGMTPIVKNTARLIAGFITVFAIYVALTGHLTPGGGFAGGVILAAAAALIVLAFGRRATRRLISETKCHLADAAGAAAFLAIAMLGFVAGGFFDNNLISHGEPGRLFSGGAIPLSNFAILVKVGAGLAGGFLALSAFSLLHRPTHQPEDTEQADGPEEA